MESVVEERRSQRRKRIQTLLLALLLALGVGCGWAGTGLAQQTPAIFLSSQRGTAGTLVQITGEGFTPGGYPANVLWDGEPIQAFLIPDGGAFAVEVLLPMDAPPGAHEVAVCAGSPCFTDGAAQRATAPFNVLAPIPYFPTAAAFIYNQDRATSELAAMNFRDLLAPHGVSLQLIPQSSVEQTDFAAFDLVLLGTDTGLGANWGTPAAVESVRKAPRLLGLGSGGYAFFGQIDSSIGYPRGAGVTDGGAIFTVQPRPIIYKTPHLFTDPAQAPLALYGPDTFAQYFSQPAADVFVLAERAVDGRPTTHASIVSQGCNTLWGYTGDPALMTRTGQALFANTVYFALANSCTVNLTTYCAGLNNADAVTIPGRRVLNFDELRDGDVVGAAYASAGILFEDGQQTQARVYADRDIDVGKSRSAPNVVLNSPVDPNTSSGVPLRISLAQPLSHAGAWVGNGKDASGGGPALTATLSAFDENDQLICTVRTEQPVDASHTRFAGIYDAIGRISRLEIDYGTSQLSESIDDLTVAPAQALQPIRVCRHEGGNPQNGCIPVAGAPVHILEQGGYQGRIAVSDPEGYLRNRVAIPGNAELWAQIPISVTGRYTLYQTTPVPQKVSSTPFYTGAEQIIHADYPLIVHDLTVATQWDLTDDPAFRARLRQDLEKASNYLFDFTDGQMALGGVTVYQNYDMWDEADVRIYASNSYRPQAVIGGVTTQPVSDPLLPALTFYPGYIYMGSEWSRDGSPIGMQRVPPEDDWAVALAHELGHYLLYLFDTYVGEDENGDLTLVESCIGSAMGWVYEDQNTEFIADAARWLTDCGNTLAHQTLGRTEWETIRLWYRDLLAPAGVTPGPVRTYIPLTSVTFIPPSTPTDQPITNPLFSLAYDGGDTASSAARGFLIRDGRVLDQGQPVSGTVQMALNNPQVGDRFCLFDILNSDGGSARHQYGCETLENGDNTLDLEKDLAWEPVIQISPVTSSTMAISVTQAVETGALGAILYPEDENTPTEIALSSAGDVHTGVFYSPIPATSAFVAVFVDEYSSETDPRREIMIDYGAGGSGAFGPFSSWGGVPIVSSDGQAQYVRSDTVELQKGEFISWQTMVGSPPVPGTRRGIGAPYRLLALPAALAQAGAVTLALPDAGPTAARQGLTPHVYYWTGDTWRSLTSRRVLGEEGEQLIVAPSQGIGVYSLQMEQGAPAQKLYLPLLEE